MKKHDCQRIRRQIHDRIDRHEQMNDSIKEHLRGCDSCRAFVSRWERFSEELEAVLDRAVSDYPQPNFQMLHKQSATMNRALKKRIRLLPWAASFLVLLALWAGYRLVQNHKTSRFIRQENRIFISQTLNQGLLEANNGMSDFYSSDFWLKETDPLIDSLFLPSSE